jgi:hypothetical protein
LVETVEALIGVRPALRRLARGPECKLPSGAGVRSDRLPGWGLCVTVPLERALTSGERSRLLQGEFPGAP